MPISGAGNQLYRVQIIRQRPARAGARFVWSRENGSSRRGCTSIPVSGAFTLIGAREDEALGSARRQVIDDRKCRAGERRGR